MRKYGVISDLSGLSAGIQVEGITIDNSAETVEAKNHLGIVTDIAVNPPIKSLTVDGLLDVNTGVTLAVPGSIIEIDGEKFLISSVSQTESNSDFVRVSITASGAGNDVEFHVIGEDTTTP